MILLCNGDSWTQGDAPAQIEYPGYKSELGKTPGWYNIVPVLPVGRNISSTEVYRFYDSSVWPKVLGEKLGWETWNCGTSGVSNQTIIRTTINSIDYLESMGKKDIFVIIQLTSLLRYDSVRIELGKKNKTDFVDKRIPTFPSEIDTPQMHFLVHQMYKSVIVGVINLQNYLKMKKLPYLIYNAFDYKIEDNFKEFPQYNYIDLNNIYNRSFKPEFKNYIENKFSVKWSATESEYFVKNHPTDISHIAWAEELYEYIRNGE
jgi:hypothetical protein